jgi:hypothetical protein
MPPVTPSLGSGCENGHDRGILMGRLDFCEEVYVSE